MLVYVCVFVSESMGMCVYIFVNIHIWACVCMPIYSSMCAYTCVHMCTCDFEILCLWICSYV